MFKTKKHKWLIIGVGIVVALAAVVLIVATSIMSVFNQGEAHQERIEALYLESRNSLSTCIDQGNVGAQVAQQEFEELKEVLTDALTARYVDENGNATNATSALGGGQLISALGENYPEIDQRSWQNLQTHVIGCRSEFQSSQDRIFADAAQFESWVLKDTPFNYWIKKQFPTDTLDVEDLATGEVLRGQPALDYMTRVIEVSEGRDAFRDGVRETQDLFGD